ncbi:hypothetical protein MPTK1_6g02610 [Marchantia polymorpha subsp. ruderalis]|uniref:Uncharacterized protein n=2 Tax=Marchantia polymorpha TaxID=3197 RepID=A0AAF6BMU4_MARPO|nr:hypothetical protein MARPO_0035s0048 [Marchantia polymorpha]BBN13328.1 hypothetical protein Mp_6g02610 [Marchantia polymorpha subsp. ruderalis]|eukprot:PTQ41256.1 hypothetical protein MARPO_0035s0048 [Marchantia polymorpha]
MVSVVSDIPFEDTGCAGPSTFATGARWGTGRRFDEYRVLVPNEGQVTRWTSRSNQSVAGRRLDSMGGHMEITEESNESVC